MPTSDAVFAPVDGWPDAADVTFALFALTTAGGPALLCPAAASCTVPACVGAADCDDDDPCTRDACARGQCTHTTAAGFPGADCQIAQVLRGLRCGEQPLHRKLVRMLYERVGKARLLLARAALKTDPGRRAHLVRRADRVLAATERRVAQSPHARACGDALAAALQECRRRLAALAAGT